MAGTTSDKLFAILVAKESIRSAIEAKGIECGQDVPLSRYSEKILSIQTESPGGGGMGCGIPGVAIDFTVSDVKVGGRISGRIIDIEKIGIYTKETRDIEVIEINEE